MSSIHYCPYLPWSTRVDSSKKNFEASLPGQTQYTASWQTPSPPFSQGQVRYAKEDRGGVKRPKPRGWKEPLPYFLLRRAFHRGSGKLHRKWQSRITPTLTYWDRYDGDVGAGQGSPADSQNAAVGVMPEGGGVDLNFMEEECYRACYIKARQQTINIGVAIGEAAKTANLLATSLRKCAYSILLLKRGRFAAAANLIGVRPGSYASNWAKKWLEWKYGWLPLMQDVYNAADHASRQNPWDWKVSASKKMRRNLNRQKIVGDGFTRCIVSATGWTGVHVRMDFIPSIPQHISALGITNPALIAYELIPYSFVLDWSVPVSEWLQGLDHNVLFESGTACVTRFTKQHWSVSGINDTGTSGQYDLEYTNDYSATREYVALTRTVRPLEAPPYPRLRNPYKSFQRLVSALALTRQAFAAPQYYNLKRKAK